MTDSPAQTLAATVREGLTSDVHQDDVSLDSLDALDALVALADGAAEKQRKLEDMHTWGEEWKVKARTAEERAAKLEAALADKAAE